MFKLTLKPTLIILSLFVAFTINAQNGQVKWDSKSHDFGKIKEEDKKVTHRFVFTNVGTDPIKLIKVKPGCGCTTSSYTKGEVLPGEQGYVEATYHTTGRPGPFRKSIAVKTNDADKPDNVLMIKGHVIKKAKTVAEKYPIAMGHLKLMKKHVHLGEVKSTQVKYDTVKIYNNWEQSMTLKFEQVPDYLEVQAIPAQLKAHQEGVIVIKLDAAKANDFGMINYNFGIRTNDNAQMMKSMGVSANIRQDFSGLTEKEKKKAPKIEFEEVTYDFGEETRGTTITYAFKFKNTGKSDLKILKVKASCGCTATKPSKNVIRRRKSGEITITFNTSGRVGNQHKTITVITNDPTNPVVTLHVKGNLVKPAQQQ